MRHEVELGPSDLEEFMQQNHISGEILYLDVPTPTVESAAAAVGSDSLFGCSHPNRGIRSRSCWQ